MEFIMDMTLVDYEQLSEDYGRVEQAIRYIEENYHSQPGLKEIAAHAGLSEYHFQRLFTRWVGISPKRFLQFLTKESASSVNLLEVAYQTGLSGPGRLHDLFVSCEAVTPGEFKNQGEGLEIQYGFHATPFGECLLALTERGICHLAFVQDGDRPQALRVLQARWKNASLREDPAATRPLVGQIFAIARGQEAAPLHLFLKGTNFQIKVWEALLRIPPGSVVSYQDLAISIGMPKAARAVGNAVGQNPLPVLIPCHRVIHKAGDFGSYHYGTARKKALLAWEALTPGPSPFGRGEQIG
jgi:AraC family transcriptional regulator of adaptative response/methylated-DNA-[protein]-cysteine methyltransferase